MRTGPHVNRTPTHQGQAAQATQRGWTAFQTFVGNPKAIEAPAILYGTQVTEYPPNQYPPDGPTWVIHAAYVATANPKMPGFRRATGKYLADMIRICDRLGAPYLVIHSGATKDQSIRDVIAGTLITLAGEVSVALHTHPNVTLCLENTAARNDYSSDPKLLSDLVGQLRHTSAPNIAFAYDTAHGNAAGHDHTHWPALASDPHLAVVHLNYPGSPRFSGRDAHAYRTHADRIDKQHKHAPTLREDFDQLIAVAATRDLPLILEGASYETTEADLEAEVAHTKAAGKVPHQPDTEQ